MLKKQKGFSLLELLIVIIILGILTCFAYPTYSHIILKSRRSDGIQSLLHIQLLQENYFYNNPTYASLATLGLSTTSPQGYYTLTINNISATGYTATATAIGKQSQDQANGTSCTVLTLTVNNTSIIQSPTACWN